MVVWTIHCQFFTSLFPSLTRRKILQITTIIHKYTAHTPFILLQQNTRQSKRDKILSSKFHKTVLAIHDTVLIHRRGTTPKVTVPGSDVSAWQQAWNTGWLSLGIPSQLLLDTLPPPPFFSFSFDRTFHFLFRLTYSSHLGETLKPNENWLRVVFRGPLGVPFKLIWM